MNFSKIIGKIDPNLVQKAEDKLSAVFLELGTRPDNAHVGTGIGGDPLIFGLMYPVQHVCTMNIPTAATDGIRYYWNPKFVLRLSKLGLRIICSHEAWHAIYMHPQRRGSRLPKLWNIAIDYIVNGTALDDLSSRKMDAGPVFAKELGKYMTLTQYAELLKNPFAKIPGFEDLNPTETDNSSQIELPAAGEDRELTAKEQKEIERREKVIKFYYADPNLSEDMKRPEAIYDYLYSLLPKCPKCGSVGKYKLPQKNKGKNKSSGSDSKDQGDKDQGDKGKKDKDQKKDHNHGDGQSCDCPDHKSDQTKDEEQEQNSCSPSEGDGCDQCGDGIDVLGLGGTIDDHMDTEETEERLAKKISDAMESAKRMAGHIPGSLEDELGKLTAPKITWQDIIRTRLLKARAGNGRNDWTKFKTRPMFSGLLTPKRKNYYAHFGCLIDTSGSMSADDMAFGLSQLASLDERSEGTIVPADCVIYWDKATKIKKANIEELSKVKIVGRGGTMFATFFDNYEKEIGKCDFLIMITDGYLLDTDLANMKNPGVDVIWLVTAKSSFNPPFGRSFDLRD